MMRIAFVGAGSGGHIYPLLAVAHAIKELSAAGQEEVELHYFGPADRYDDVLRGEGMALHRVPGGKMRRYASLQNLLDAPKVVLGLFVALYKLLIVMPDALFSKGGTGAFPIILAAWFYRIPIVIHESDIVPSVTNALSGRFARRVTASFEEALQYFRPDKRIHSGNPERPGLLESVPDQETAKKNLEFDPAEPLLLVLGGSQGSERVNEFIVLALAELIAEFQVLHQTGERNFLDVQKLSQAALAEVPANVVARHRYVATAYLDERSMRLALAAADIVISRAGSNAIFEIAAFGKPAILVPLDESANDHQRLNAYAYAEKGGAIVIEERNLFPGIMLDQVREITQNPSRASGMRAAAQAFVKRDAAARIAREVLDLAR